MTTQDGVPAHSDASSVPAPQSASGAQAASAGGAAPLAPPAEAPSAPPAGVQAATAGGASPARPADAPPAPPAGGLAASAEVGGQAATAVPVQPAEDTGEPAGNGASGPATPAGGGGEGGGGGQGGRLPCLDGVRAIAALGVILVHVGLISGYNMRAGAALGPYFARAEVGVTVFFLLSGFLVYRPFVAAHLDGREAPAVGSYLVRRVLRIVPLYWVALTIVLFVHHRSPVDNVGDLVTYYGFGQIYRRGYETGGIQQAWSLCTLVAFYLAVPVLALVARSVANATASARRSRTGPTPATRLRVELALAGAMIAFGYAYRWAVVIDIPHREAVVDGRLNGLPIHADVFGFGMALAALYAWGQRQPADRPTFARAAGRVPAGVWWGVAAVAYWYVSVRVGLPLTAGAHGPGEWMAREVLYTVVTLGLLMPAVFGPQDRGPVRWVLRWRPVAAVGVLTYGVFMWHEWAIDRWIEWRDLQPLNVWWPGMLAFVVAFTLAVSALTYWLIEKPFARLLGRRPATPAPAPAPAA